MNELVVRKLKFDGSVSSEWDADLVAEIGQEWLVTRHDGARHQIRDDHVREPNLGFVALHYLSTTRPLSIQFRFEGRGQRFLEAKCDAALPATRHGNTIDFVDLDLDVVVLPGGMHYIRDQDIFAERSVSMAYTEEAKRQAHLGILHGLRMVRRNQFPFDGHAERLAATFL